MAALAGVLASLLAGLPAATLSYAAQSPPTSVSPVVGAAQVVDGDTFDVAGQRIRLEGIDAPEATQACLDASARSWPCGRRATAELRRLTAGQPVTCHSRGQDKYQRLLAMCFVNGLNINEAMVRRGYAWAFVKYSTEFADLEAEARRASAGVWQGTAQAPWDYRRNEWTVAEAAAPTGCAIKGNISDNGQIYHVPWSAWYDRVRIDEAQGERWFCTEDAAIAAGWRAAISY